jgi:threonine dehydrogenase-like Zn-dependent dehydrogenase
VWGLADDADSGRTGKVKALTFEGVGVIRLGEVAEPTIVESTDVLVRVERTAICGSDMHVYHGREQGLDHGTVMGHEFAGTVLAVGDGVRSLTVDQPVFSPFTTSCGACVSCRSGLTARCTAGQLFGWVAGGQGLHGAQTEIVRVPLADTTLIPLPQGLSPEVGLLMGDVLSTGYFCAVQAGVAPGGTYAVLGCGPVGLMAVLSAIELGAERVFAVDSETPRLRQAARFGATTIDLTKEDTEAVVRQATDGQGVDAVLEAVGNAAAHQAALGLVRAGGTISVVGVHNEERFPFTPVELYDRNLTYRVGRCPARAMAERVMPLARRRATELESILTHRLPLSRGPEAYEIFDGKRDGCIKVVLSP